MEAKDPLSPKDLDELVQRTAEKLLRDAKIWDFHSFGWLDAETVDPEFAGHAMWQISPPSDIYLEFPFLSRRSREARRPPPTPNAHQKRLMIAGADLGGLMTAARMTFGLLLLQLNLRTGNIFHDDKTFDLHWMSTVIYLSTSSDRMREFFVAAVFEQTLDAYNRSGHYNGAKRSYYSTPFIEASDTAKSHYPDVAKSFDLLVSMATDIYTFQKTRNELIHEVATAIGNRERHLLDRDLTSVPDKSEHRFSFADLERTKRDAESAHEKRISGTICQLKSWYNLIIKASNEAFIIENKLRRAIET